LIEVDVTVDEEQTGSCPTAGSGRRAAQAQQSAQHDATVAGQHQRDGSAPHTGRDFDRHPLQGVAKLGSVEQESLRIPPGVPMGRRVNHAAIAGAQPSQEPSAPERGGQAVRSLRAQPELGRDIDDLQGG
jgi:hypothetical protein